MAVIHKGVDKIIDSSSNEVVIATVKATIDNQANKADIGHGHNIDDLTDVEVTGASAGQVLSFTMNLNGTGVPGWEPATVSSSGGGSADLGIAVTTAGGDVDYEFNATTPSGVPGMDTSSLAAGSTMMWNGSSWVDSGLIIESI